MTILPSPHRLDNTDVLSLHFSGRLKTPELSGTGISSGSPLKALSWGTAGMMGLPLALADATLLWHLILLLAGRWHSGGASLRA